MLYTGTTKITPLIYSKGGTATLTVVNHSSFDRSANEKVFLNQITGGWEIIDYASADINSITAKCDENIAKNGTGTVSLSANGQLMNHEVRDFILGGNTTESNINDNSHLLTYNFNGQENDDTGTFIISSLLNYTAESLDNSHVKIVFKLEDLSDNQDTDLNALEIYLGYLTNVNTNSWDPLNASRLGRYQMLSDKFQAIFYDNNTSTKTLQINKNVGTLLKWNTWMTFDMYYVNSWNATNLTIKHTNGDVYDITYGGYGINRNIGNISKFFIGTNSVPNGSKFRLTFDLSKCIITNNNNEVRWKPYKEIIA